MLQITGYCCINHESVCINGNTVYSNNTTDIIDWLSAIYKGMNMQYPKFAKMDTLCKLGFLTAEMLMNTLPDSKEKYPEYERTILMSNKSGSLNTDQQYWQSVSHIPSPSLFVGTLPNIVNAEICIRHKFKGENHFFISPDFDALQMVEYVELLFNQQDTRFCLCGWIEVFDNDYKSCIFAIENAADGLDLFTAQNLNRLYNI